MFSVCPHLGGGGYPSQVQMGVPRVPPRHGWGTPLARSVWGGIGVPPPPRLGQQKEYSVRGGRYASCVHAGLSCFDMFRQSDAYNVICK